MQFTDKKQFFEIFRQHNFKNTCLACDFDSSNCSKEPILSHTIAKIEQLSKLAEDSKVLILDKENIEKLFHLYDENDGKPTCSFTLRTIKKASVFPGFCNYHDTILFNLIDKPIIQFNNEVLLQMHYRAVCYEFHAKKRLLDILDLFPENIIEPYKREAYIQGYENLKKEKEICERAYATSNVNRDVKAIVFEFNVPTPVECVGGYAPFQTIDGKTKLFIPDFHFIPMLGLTLGHNAAGKAFWAITYTSDDEKIQIFINNLKKHLNKRPLDIAILFCLQKSENACCRPSWFNSLQQWQRDFINDGFCRSELSKLNSVTGVKLLNFASSATQII